MRSTTNQITGIHKWPLLGAAAVAVLALVLVVGTVVTKEQTTDLAGGQVVAERLLYFIDGKDGNLLVYDARTREKLGHFGKGEGAFARISMRSLMRQRKLKEVDYKHPFKLVRTEHGQLVIMDPKAEQRIRINAFGKIAIDNFAKFLPEPLSTGSSPDDTTAAKSETTSKGGKG